MVTRRSPARRRAVAAAALALALLLPLLRPPAAGAAGAGHPREYEVKAAYLYNFARLTEWPQGSLPAPHEPFVIGILGEDPFGDVLERTLAGERVQGSMVGVRRLTHSSQAAQVHLLFVSASERRGLPSILRQVRGRPVLTVGDGFGFAARGCVIGLFLEGNSVRFEVNREAAERAGLKLSSQLLKLASFVPRE